MTEFTNPVQRLVSVIIPCYCQACFLPHALESVRQQDYPHREVIVVDDGSPDDTSSVATRYPEVRTLRQPNQGLPSARNTGWKNARGHWSFTRLSIRQRFCECFPESRVETEACGNVLAALAFLAALSVSELRREELDHDDPQYELLISVRAQKPTAA